jgi:tetratricopeptide (TPR) repeat protein
MMPEKVEKLCQRAQLAIAERDWDKAKQSYLKALGLRSDLPDVHYGLATVYFQQRELTSAAHHFREVARLDPSRAGALINLGAVLNVLGQFDEAVDVLRKGLKLDPQRTEGYYNLGLVYKRKGETDLAIAAYKEALRLNPRMADAHLNLGHLLFERELAKQALHHYEQALALRKNWEKAIEAIEAAKEWLKGPPDEPSSALLPTGGPIRVAPPPGSDQERMIDPITHAAFLSTLHDTTIVTEETGKLLAGIIGDEVHAALKEISSSLLQTQSSRSDLDTSLHHLETSLDRMKHAHQALKTVLHKLEIISERFPAH